jgi:hypothetical protein
VSDPRHLPDDRPPVDAPSLEEEIQSLQGEELPIDQDAFLDPDEFEERREPTRTELDQGDPITDPRLAGGEVATLDGLAMQRGMREGETEDAGVAAQEGLTWVPPIDPPVVPSRDDEESVEMAAGFGVDALADPYDADHRSGEPAGPEGDLNARVRDALRADAATSVVEDRIAIGVRGDTVVVRGVVDDVDTSDDIVAVIERVAGVREVVDETELAE